LPETFIFKDKTYNLKDWLKEHWTTGLVILKIDSPTKAKLLHESYYLGNNCNTKTISWSVGKSVVSALIGIAISDGKIKSVDDDVTMYIPQLKTSAYDGVKIKNVLQMSSGVKFNEDYDDIFSDINRMAYWIAMGYNLIDFIKTLQRDKEPGTVHNYISIDTQVLGMVLKNATGQSLTSYLEEKLWKNCGFESECFWLIDNEQSATELAFGTLNSLTRDYARFGWLYMNKGLSPLDGTRILDSEWINDSTTIKINDQHLRPNYPDQFGYGFQWWIPGDELNPSENKGDYLAIGVYNQIVIARNSANPNYNKEFDMVTNSNTGETQAVAAFRAISKYVSK
jgi:CubicO group peptidase (beta-lactamase class C family)